MTAYEAYLISPELYNLHLMSLRVDSRAFTWNLQDTTAWHRQDQRRYQSGINHHVYYRIGEALDDVYTYTRLNKRRAAHNHPRQFA